MSAGKRHLASCFGKNGAGRKFDLLPGFCGGLLFDLMNRAQGQILFHSQVVANNIASNDLPCPDLPLSGFRQIALLDLSARQVRNFTWVSSQRDEKASLALYRHNRIFHLFSLLKRKFFSPAPVGSKVEEPRK